jgi:hypothetical protein
MFNRAKYKHQKSLSVELRVQGSVLTPTDEQTGAADPATIVSRESDPPRQAYEPPDALHL